MNDEKKEAISTNAVEHNNNNNKNNNYMCYFGALIIIACILMLWFFNRKFNAVFNYNNGNSADILYVKYNTIISENDIKNENDLGDSFIGWYEIINKNIELKAIYDESTDKIVISFDSRVSSDVSDLSIEKGASLVLPTNTTKKGYTFGHWETDGENSILDGANLSESRHYMQCGNRYLI